MPHLFKKSVYLIVILTVVFSVVGTPNLYAAEPEAAPILLTPIEGFVTDTEAADLGKYINGFMRLAIAIATGLAVVMIVIGGVSYMITGNPQKKKGGKDMIREALFGLALALVSFLLLRTVNEDLVKLNFITTLDTLGQQAISQAPTSTGVIVAEEREEAVRNILESAGIIINNPCPPGENMGCTNVGGLTDNTISSAVDFAELCECQFIITGGSEGGHTSHNEGNKLDLRPTASLNGFIGATSGIQCGANFSKLGRNFTWEPKGCKPCPTCGASTGDHWHSRF